MDVDELEKDIANIYGLDYFETVSYRVVKEEGKTGVVIIAKEKTAGLDSFRFGLNLENDFNGDSAYNTEILIDDLKQNIDDIAAGCGFAGRVVLMPDAVMSGNDCRLEWADGGAVRNLESILDDIETGIKRTLQNPTDLSGDISSDELGGSPDQPAVTSR